MSLPSLFASACESIETLLFALDGLLGLLFVAPTLSAAGSLGTVEVDDGDGNAVVVVVGAAPPARFPSAVVVMEIWPLSPTPLRRDGAEGASP